ncbi:Hypothetical predicted protein [Mytilus galloprovincialis]|uniref:Fibronectin type-III domain-containing protein n=1 Tax=Mytilus galloprovincialis TaxID=29158 RepID=A0A8B6G9C6_MYTGA|nr:Hypothetical predicted protein [Mytilus galloprovincialis]
MKIHRFFLAIYSLLTLLATGNLAEIPNPPGNLKVVNVGPGFVKLSWTPVPGEKINFYKLHYRQKGDSSSIFSEERMRDPAHKVRRLTPFTDYEFQVIAVNDVGDSRPTDIIEKRTSSSAPGTPPQNVRAISLSPSTALVKWNKPARPNGIIKGYKIFYTLEPDIPLTLWTTLDIPLPQANKRQATITELKANKIYSLCVLAYSMFGVGPISDLEQVMTKPGAEDSVLKTPVTPGPSSKSNSSKLNSKPMKRKKMVDDINEIQHKVYKKELIKQDKEIEKLNLQIELLNSLKGNSSVSGSSSVNQLLLNCLLHM